MERHLIPVDANEAVAGVAYQLSDVIAIYPITPSSRWASGRTSGPSEARPNLWGTVPAVVEMQSEGGAAGAVHGALQTGSLPPPSPRPRVFSLMIPNMYKIAGELTPAVFHVAARSLAAQGLSIFGDHSDVMATRADRLWPPVFRLGAGGAGPGADRPRRDAGSAHSLHPFLRRLPHLP